MCDSTVFTVARENDDSLREMLDEAHEEHAGRMAELDAIVASYFSLYEKTDDGITAALAKRMSPHRRFKLLEDILDREYYKHADNTLFVRMNNFVSKNDAEDFISHLDFNRDKILVACRCGKAFSVWRESERLPNHEEQGGAFCFHSHLPGICVLSE